MKFSKILLLFLLFNFAVFKVKAQSHITKADIRIVELVVKPVKRIESTSLKPLITPNKLLVYGKLEHLNNEVNSRIKCTFDFFNILNDKVTC